MMSPGRLTQSQWSEAAARCLEEAEAIRRRRQYEELVGQAWLFLHQHGLGQTLAYLQARGGNRPESPYQLLFEHLARQLTTRHPRLSNDILAALVKEDSRLYRQASAETWGFLQALRQAITAQGQESAGAGRETSPAPPAEGQ
jgi:hypothetical protein